MGAIRRCFKPRRGDDRQSGGVRDFADRFFEEGQRSAKAQGGPKTLCCIASGSNSCRPRLRDTPQTGEEDQINALKAKGARRRRRSLTDW